VVLSGIMASTRLSVVAVVAFALSGCVSGPVQRGALIGIASGAAVGAGAGALIGDEKLLGSTQESKLALSSGSTIPAGAVIGAVFGGIIGAMIGHGNDVNAGKDATPDHASAQQPAAF
jgi:hypothetical protein